MKLVLSGDKGTATEKEKIIFFFDPSISGAILMKKTKGRRRIDWSGFHPEEAVKILRFFTAAVKKMKEKGRHNTVTLLNAAEAGREAARALRKM